MAMPGNHSCQGFAAHCCFGCRSTCMARVSSTALSNPAKNDDYANLRGHIDMTSQRDSADM